MHVEVVWHRDTNMLYRLTNNITCIPVPTTSTVLYLISKLLLLANIAFVST